MQVPFEDRDLVAQGQDFHILGSVTHREQPEHRQRVGHGEVGQSKQHSKTYSPMTISDRTSRPRSIEGRDQGGRHYRHPQGRTTLSRRRGPEAQGDARFVSGYGYLT